MFFCTVFAAIINNSRGDKTPNKEKDNKKDKNKRKRSNTEDSEEENSEDRGKTADDEGDEVEKGDK